MTIRKLLPRVVRNSVWVFLVPVVFAILAGLIAKVRTGESVTAGVATLIAGSVLSVAATEWKKRRDALDARDRALRMATSDPLRRGGFRRVKTLSPEALGARKPLLEARYVPRLAVESDLRAKLREGKPVLVLGASLVGKTRVAAHVIHTDYPERELVQPLVVGNGLERMLSVDPPSESIIWLDDLDTHLDGANLRDDWLRRLSAPALKNVIVATMRHTSYAALLENDDRSNPSVRVVRDHFAKVRFEDTAPEPREVVEAALGIAETDVACRIGLGPYLGGGHLALERFESGTDRHPWGVALIRAAADCQRLGLRSLPAPALKKLAGEYLDPKQRYGASESTEAGLIWATQREHDVVQLLEQPADGAHCVSGYLFEHLAAGFGPYPRILDTGCDYAAVGSVAARRAS